MLEQSKAVIESDSKAFFSSGRLRTILSLAIVAAAYFLQDLALGGPYHLVRAWLAIAPPPAPNTLVCAAYALLVLFRLAWWLIVAVLVARVDGRGIAEVLRLDAKQASYFVRGLVIGLAVMASVILTTVALGDAQLQLSSGTALLHAAYGVAWMAAEIVGAAGEEVLYRGLILLLAARLFGLRTALILSALAFSLAHGANPGASYLWMIRLFAAGLLLAYSVFRSGALWWGIGYHAGWNLGSAPLFGAAGSGYINQGHIFTFTPTGSALMTGGSVGPEGSVLAFVAVIVATALLAWTVPRRVHTND